MNQRIRYIKDTTGGMMGNQFYRADDGKEYQVSWSEGDGSNGVHGQVVEVGAGVVAAVTASSPHKIKIKLKDALVKLGCQFATEVRVKKTEEVVKE